jgi:hypothetical protein
MWYQTNYVVAADEAAADLFGASIAIQRCNCRRAGHVTASVHWINYLSCPSVGREPQPSKELTVRGHSIHLLQETRLYALGKSAMHRYCCKEPVLGGCDRNARKDMWWCVH